MDIASLIGLIMGFVMLVYGIISNHADIVTYLNFPSAIITFGGALFATMLSYSMQDFLNSMKSITLIFKTSAMNTSEMIKSIIDLSNVARKEGLLSLEEAAADLDEPFLKKGILLIVDGTDPDLVRGIMETELVSVEARHKTVIGFWEALAAMGPAWGMIGTLVGLVNMLKSMDMDSGGASSLGADMSVALVTTFYGCILANLIFSPIAKKLRIRNDEEMQYRTIMMEGIMSIQAGDNPKLLREKLVSNLDQKTQAKLRDGGEGGGEGGGGGKKKEKKSKK